MFIVVYPYKTVKFNYDKLYVFDTDDCTIEAVSYDDLLHLSSSVKIENFDFSKRMVIYYNFMNVVEWDSIDTSSYVYMTNRVIRIGDFQVSVHTRQSRISINDYCIEMPNSVYFLYPVLYGEYVIFRFMSKDVLGRNTRYYSAAVHKSTKETLFWSGDMREATDKKFAVRADMTLEV